jgi:uncharacterized protein
VSVQVAPFLELDASPYPVVEDGRVKWVIDAYTTSERLPVLRVAARSRSGRPHLPVNYVRNSSR